jgi:hypothetical protein
VEIEKESAEPAAVAVEAQSDEKHGEHSDINASYEVNCAKPMIGSQIKIPMMTLFPKIKKISIQILKDSGQTQTEINSADAVITL